MNKLKVEIEDDKTIVLREDNHFFPACYLNGGPPILHSGQVIESISYEHRKGAVDLATAIMEASHSIAYIVVKVIDGNWRLTMWEYPIDYLVQYGPNKKLEGPYYGPDGHPTQEWVELSKKYRTGK